jgi:uncharacterized protein (DUF2147 family)
MHGRVRTTFLLLFFVLRTSLMLADNPQDAVGFWKTVDRGKGFTTSVIAVYIREDCLVGRIIVSNDEHNGAFIETFHAPMQRISKLKGNPYLLGINLFWGLKRAENRWVGGKVFDPRSGNTFRCEVWVDKDVLILRGQVGPFGLNNRFYPALEEDFPPEFILPDLASMESIIPDD